MAVLSLFTLSCADLLLLVYVNAHIVAFVDHVPTYVMVHSQNISCLKMIGEKMSLLLLALTVDVTFMMWCR